MPGFPNGGHVRRNVIGAVEPKSGKLVSLIVPHCDTAIFQAFLDTLAQESAAASSRRVCQVLDKASWHKTKGLNWHHIEPVFLPAYSPDLNPIERLWQYLKGHAMAGILTADGEHLENELAEAIKQLQGEPQLVRSACALPTL